MKKQFFLFLLLHTVVMLPAQLVPCRPKICMIDYNYHNDLTTNADMTAIKNAKPDILIDNTPGGYWGQQNGGTGCLPAQYTPLGIQVFSYIAGGYEGTLYGSNIDNLVANLARVDAIANDHATGVFLDEVSSFPTTAGKNYITAIWDRCVLRGLKLIVNPGVSSFDPWLMNHCHFLLSDEHYDGTRTLTSSELPFRDRILVVNEGVNTAAAAAAISTGARAQGFGYSYACFQYLQLPPWLTSYLSLSTVAPATPVITQNSLTLQSNAPWGNQWYRTGQGAIAGATATSYTATAGGTYYDHVILQGCPSDTSNRISLVVTALSTPANTGGLRIFPTPAMDKLFITSTLAGQPVITVTVYDMAGRRVKEFSTFSGAPVNINFLPPGVYIFIAMVRGSMVRERVVVGR